MNTTLIVVRPFGTHAIGDMITDVSKATALLAGEHAHDVVRVPYNQEALSPVWNDSEADSCARKGEV